uniref:Odorant-binding protein 33 n=1 Tax=Bradysia odoriphaga TaxID=1564500 RepID=A0A2S0X9J3_9DIPT|nr:odorant-binding protein 33 [Bradysia odoriphaga]
MIFVFILFGFLTHTISTLKSDTFPPMNKVRKHYDIDRIAKVCYEKSGVDKSELHKFEVTEDLQHIPNSHAIKVYLRCFAELSEAVAPDSNKVLLPKFMKYFDDLTPAEQLIYLNMGKGCLGRVSKITDLLEYSYKIAVCGKRNDNEHFHIFY